MELADSCKIKDMYLAAYLSSLGFVFETRLESAQPGQPPRPVFYFPTVSPSVALSYFKQNIPFSVDGKEIHTSPSEMFYALRDLHKKFGKLLNDGGVNRCL